MTKLKIVSWNINGLRTRFKNKQLDPIFNETPDIILFQEIKAKYDQLDSELTRMPDYNFYISPAENSRFGGIATFSKIKPSLVKKFLKNPNSEFKGRILNFDFEDFNLVHIHSPSGSGAKVNLESKLSFYEDLIAYSKEMVKDNVIIAGDFNIAHNEKDVSDPESAVKSPNFLKNERKFLDELEDLGFIDAYRLLNKNTEEYSSWKSVKARKSNHGSRLDYFFVSQSLKNSIIEAKILSLIEGSKHAPIEMIIDI
ncbi:MAG: exodeoxyribonuclease III [Methanobacteriaceae archaeon]|jgi:exodeoxyribonuclease-3|nr:exodeoxyribonuclease III [Candidatus Methanorudis spinitermitis]